VADSESAAPIGGYDTLATGDGNDIEINDAVAGAELAANA
jgi:hypothetical protein